MSNWRLHHRPSYSARNSGRLISQSSRASSARDPLQARKCATSKESRRYNFCLAVLAAVRKDVAFKYIPSGKFKLLLFKTTPQRSHTCSLTCCNRLAVDTNLKCPLKINTYTNYTLLLLFLNTRLSVKQ